jgi:hypothetical protein|tara:strand:+ start:92 stop:394 length:303 start_codon:yes stop_codon:yes gene_type:complete
MKLTEIKYKNVITKVVFKKIEDYAIYTYNDNTLTIREGLTNQLLGKTLFHELFHIIISINDFKVGPHGEEKVAGLTEQYYTILKSNPVLKNLIMRCIKDV